MEGVWQELGVKEKLGHLLRTGHISDCVFIVGSEVNGGPTRFELHKFILSCASPVFERMLHSDFLESAASQQIVLSSTNPMDFKKLIDYIYFEDAKKLEHLEINKLKNLFLLSDHYMMTSLKNICIKFLKARIFKLDMHHLSDVFEFSCQIGEEDIKAQVLTKIKDISSSKKPITCTRIYNLNVDVFYELLNNLKGIVTERVRFDLIETYAKVNDIIEMDDNEKNVEVAAIKNSKKSDKGDIKSQSQNQSQQIIKENEKKTVFLFLGKKMSPGEIINLLLELIDFNLMNTDDFSNGPGNSPLLDIRQKYEILVGLCNKKPFTKNV